MIALLWLAVINILKIGEVTTFFNLDSIPMTVKQIEDKFERVDTVEIEDVQYKSYQKELYGNFPWVFIMSDEIEHREG